MSHLSEIINLPLSRPIEIELTYVACQGQVVISISHILVSGGYCEFGRFVQFFEKKLARLPCQLNSSPFCILFLFGQDPFSIGIKFYIHHFLYILSKAQQIIVLLYIHNMIYKYNDLKIIRLNTKNLNQIMFY